MTKRAQDALERVLASKPKAQKTKQTVTTASAKSPVLNALAMVTEVASKLYSDPSKPQAVKAASSLLDIHVAEYAAEDVKRDKTWGQGYLPTARVLVQREQSRQSDEINAIGEKLLGKQYASEPEGEKGLWVTYRDNRDPAAFAEKMSELSDALGRAGYKVKTVGDGARASYYALFDKSKLDEAHSMYGKFLQELAKRGGKTASMVINTMNASAKVQAARYGNDPRWLDARYPGVDANGRSFKRGDRILYYPKDKRILTGPEAEQAMRDVAADDHDERMLGGSVTPVRAAKDTGTASKDKAREASLQRLLETSKRLCVDIDLEGFPEVKAACTQVDKLTDMATKMRELQVRLKMSPANSEEATQHQTDLDGLRDSVDTLIAPLEATLSTMEAMVAATAALEEQFQALNDQVKAMEEKLKSDKDKLASIAKAVETTAKIG